MSCVRTEGTLSRSEFIPNQKAYPEPAKIESKVQKPIRKKLRIMRVTIVGAMLGEEWRVTERDLEKGVSMVWSESGLFR
jgi:hypothetical protein